MRCPTPKRSRRLWALLLIPLFFLLSFSISAESFFPDGDGSFFGERAKQPRIKLPSLPIFDKGAESEENEGDVSEEEKGPKTQYRWLVSYGAMGDFSGDTIFEGGMLGINSEFLLLKHLGIGLGIWVNPNNWHMPGPADGGWVEVDPYFDIVDGGDVSEQESLYAIVQTGLPMTGFTVNVDWYPGDRGLSGFYTSLEGGVIVSWGWDFYPEVDASQPVIHIGGEDEVPLPGPTTPVGLLFTPHAGYKLHLGWLLLELKAGYAFGSWDVLNGYIVGLNFGFSPGVRK